MTITFDSSWRMYRTAEVRLPRVPASSARSQRTPEARWGRASGLREVLDLGLYDAVVLDAWGVLNLGDEPIPSARGAFEALRASGLPLRVLSNDASSDAPQSAARHARRGFHVQPEEIIYGLDLLGPELARLGLAPGDCALIAPRPAPRAALTEAMVDLDSAAADDALALVFLSTVDYTQATDARLRSLLRQRARPLIVCNPDIVSPDPVGMSHEPGLYAHALAEELDVLPLFLGKPFEGVYEALMQTLPGVVPARVLCVGDTLHTDVWGGAAAGMGTLLVESGYFRGEDAWARCDEAGLWPTWISPHL